MKLFFFGCSKARALSYAFLVSLFAGVILPILDWKAAQEAGWSAAAWSIYWIASAIYCVGALVYYNHKRKIIEAQSIFK